MEKKLECHIKEKNSERNNVSQFIQELTSDSQLSGQIAYNKLILSTSPQFANTRQPLSAASIKLLDNRKLYSHQALALDHIKSGHSIIVSTSTASGKSLIYNLAVYERFLHDPEAKALYLFPLKALAQDQLAAFRRLGENWPKEARPDAALYDGDTTDWQRKKIRANPPAILMTNPEMLHLSILPHHESWSVFLANLAFIIVDEAHSLRGIFGSHMAQVFRRLNRICSRYGTEPTYILSTATLGNPVELASRLTGLPEKPILIDQSGAPQAHRHFLFVNPLRSAASTAIDILNRALEHGLRTIVYCQSRKMAELISLWASAGADKWKDRISPYRAGFLPEERREIEARMSSGELLAVISTSALELGIDIGNLDVCILVGYPGTIMQTLQRGGRVGRNGREAAVILLAGEDALDQYFMRNPEEFFSRPLEKAIINPQNRHLLKQHLECAAAEFPLNEGEEILCSEEAREALKDLDEEGLIKLSSDGQEWLHLRKNPHRFIDLRGNGASWTIENESGAIIGNVDGHRAFRETHPGAVYIHRGQNYLIDSMDYGRRKILATKCEVKWHTRIRAVKSSEIMKEYGRAVTGRSLLGYGRLRITEIVRAYEKRANEGNRLLNVIPLDVPPAIYETEGIWFVVPDSVRRFLENSFFHFMGSIHALEHSIIGLLPLEVMADRNDFGGISTPLHPQLGYPAVFIYDAIPGGAGLTHAVRNNALSLLETVQKTVSGCPCEDGCPSCIQSPKCGAGNRPLSKKGLITLLSELLKPGLEGEELLRSLEISPANDALQTPKFPEKINGYAKTATSVIKTCIPVAKKTALPPEEILPEIQEMANSHAAISPSLHYVVFDVETRLGAVEVGGWQNADKMGVSIAVLYDSDEDEFFTYEQNALEEMFKRMAKAELVIGFNNLRFDNLVLRPFAEKMRLANDKSFNLATLPTLDILDRIFKKSGCRIALDNLASATLNAEKSASGLLALRWWKQGKIAKIAEYCKKDVELTRDLYLFGLREKYLYYTNKARKKTRINIDF